MFGQAIYHTHVETYMTDKLFLNVTDSILFKLITYFTFKLLSSQQFASSPTSLLPLLYSLSGFLFNFLYLTSSTLLTPIPISLPCIFSNSWHAPLIMNRKPKLAKEVPIGMQPNDQERKTDWRQREGKKKKQPQMKC